MSDQQQGNQLVATTNPRQPTVDEIVDETERLLRVKHPKLAGYLDVAMHAVWMGGNAYDVLGEVHFGRENAAEAVRAAIMDKLIAVDRSEP